LNPDEKDYKPQTARSVKTGIIDDNFSVHINIKWLGQLLIAIFAVIYGYLEITNRIAELERRMELANSDIEELVEKHIKEEEVKITEMQEKLEWYQKELNLSLNPLSWGKKKRRK
tara:strand:+ start:625 stop:969 length:345 start_codon:yes stop_codon:yes gene_type:complete